MKAFKVRKDTDVKNLASFIAKELRDDDSDIELTAIGAGAVNQAQKAIAVARGYLIVQGIDIYSQPSFCNVTIDDTSKSAMKFTVHKMK